MCGNFWLKIISQRFPTHRTALTWLREISFYSPSSKPTSKDIILRQLKTMRVLNNISSEDFLHCYEEWQQRWSRCILSQGAYFKGDKL